MEMESFNNPVQPGESKLEQESKAQYENNENRLSEIASELNAAIETGDDDAALALIQERKQIRSRNDEIYGASWQEANEINSNFDNAQSEQPDTFESEPANPDQPESSLDTEKSIAEEIFQQMETVSSREELADLVRKLGDANTANPGYYRSISGAGMLNAKLSANNILQGYGMNISDSRVQRAANRVYESDPPR